MALITGIVPAPDRPGHVVILVDGKPFAVVPEAEAPGLAGAGTDAAATVAKLEPLDDATKKTYARALNLLAFRPRSKRELGRKLRDKGEPPAQVDATLARLEVHGFVDDGKYAEAHARSGIQRKARSVRRLQYDLAQKGIGPAMATAAIRRAMAEAGTTERDVAERAARKKLRGLARLPPDERRRKLYAFLARQAYGADVVRAVLRAVLDADVDDC